MKKRKYDPLRPLLMIFIGSNISGCFYGNEFNWASRKDVIEAAAECGLEGFEPSPAGEGWEADVPTTNPREREIEDCIYDIMHERDLLLTRTSSSGA